jgi:1-acyl-sn-glycerol-3-phosphate acyltransferase
VTHNRTPRVLRVLRWARLFAHLAAAMFILRFVFPRASRARRRQLIGRWSRKLIAIFNVTVRVTGTPPGVDEAAMIAANHVSSLDIFLISSLRPTRFVAKSEIREWPVAGFIAQRSGTIFIRRAQRHDTARINERVQAALGEGDCVGLFPEAQTTEGDRLLKFHSSLFEPAVANGARVHPVALRYEHPDGTPCRSTAYVGDLSFAQSMGLIIRTRAIVARVAFAEPIEPAERTRRELATLAYARVASLLGFPDKPPGTPAGH